MIRPFTCVCAILAGASGLYLYSEKHRTTLLDQQISAIVSDTQAIRERTAMLRAEWALLNQPDRLQVLATRFLPQLQAMAPTQFVQMASLDHRLPPPGAEVPPHPIATPQTAPGLVGQAPTALASAQAPAPDAILSARAEPAPTTAGTAAAPRPVRLAQAHPFRSPLVHVAAAHREVALADAGPVLAMHAAATHRAAATLRATAPVHLAAYAEPHARPVVATAGGSYAARPPIEAAAAWRPARASWPAQRPASYAVPQTASALGSSLGGGSHLALPAPVPLSDGN